MRDDDKPLDPEIEAYVFALMSGGTFQPPSLDDEPEVDVHGWEIMAVTGGWGSSHHVVGVWDGVGRVSSPIQAFDPEMSAVTTKSGRLYRLGSRDARISETRDREYVRGVWLRRNSLGRDEFSDATAIYEKRLSEAKGDGGNE